MSSDTTKENASVVDSSMTEWKHDMGNSDDPESSTYKVSEDRYPFRAEEAGQSQHQLESSTSNKSGKLYKTRYFIIKSLNHQNIQLSIKRGIWATQVMNEPILEEAFHNSGRVILIFSVNMSGFFQGYAQMMSSVGWRRDNVWSQGNGRGNPWGRSFKVKWLQLNDLPFQQTLHLKNPLNDYKPVKISRDCQELPQDIGESLCELLDGNSDVEGSLKSFPRDDLPSKRNCVESTCSLGDEDYNEPPSILPWARTHLPYPPLLYQHHTDLNRYQLARQRSASATGNLPIAFGMSNFAKSKHSHLDGNLSKLHMEYDMSSQFDFWGLPAQSPVGSTLTEEDFLDMSYEEYLEAHGRRVKQLRLPVGRTSRTVQEASRIKRHDDELSPRVDADRGHSQKKARHLSCE